MDAAEGNRFYAQGFALLKGNQPYLAIEKFKKKSDAFELFELVNFPRETFFPNVPHVALFHNVKLFSYQWILLDSNKIYNEELSGRNVTIIPIIKNRISENIKFVVINQQEAKTTMHLSQTAIFLGGDENYCHWITRYLMRLMLIEDQPFLKKLPFIVNSDLHNYQRESLQMLGIPEDQLIKIPPETLLSCDTLIVPINIFNDLFTKAVKWVRQKLLNKFVPKGTKRIYVSREDTDRRKMTNESEVLELLERHGFEKVIPGKFSFAEQIEIFSQASVIVGAHGAGLTNAIFAPQNSILIELSDVIVSYMQDFKQIAASVPLQYHALVSDKIQTYPYKLMHDYHDFVVDVPKLEQLLTQIPHL